MDGPTLSWYQWMTRNGFITSWPALLQALESRFAPTFYDDPHGALFKLQHKGSMNEYLSEFERLANRSVGLAPLALLSFFISGLYSELRKEVQALQPISLLQAVTLAKLQEEKFQDKCRHSRPPPSPSLQSQTGPPHYLHLRVHLSNDCSRKNWPFVVTRVCVTTVTRSGFSITSVSHDFIS